MKPKTKLMWLAALIIGAMLAVTALAQTNGTLTNAPVTAAVASAVTNPLPVNVDVVAAAANTNGVPVPDEEVEVPEGLESILKLLPDWLVKPLMWLAAFALALAPFANWLSNKLQDLVNQAAESAETDDDEYLRKLFSNPVYRVAAFVLNLANIRLKTLGDLERAIEQQREAVLESQGTGEEKLRKAQAILSESQVRKP